MSGCRRRPILGDAVDISTSTAAATHEVREQELVEDQQEDNVRRKAKPQRRREEEQKLRTQKPIEKAMKRPAPENQDSQESTPAVSSPPQTQYYKSYPSIPVQTHDRCFCTHDTNATSSIKPVPAYPLESQTQEGSLQCVQDFESLGSALRFESQYCTQCGFACQAEDRFCRQCGAEQEYQERMVE
ncbi:hypothetical protein DER46DRAFT_494118 [Fusarium sp. MPI-SDFR-AT-0072]|nr:hypothetical protein DER46DRAFT_494118 [Fusarium sp. MPI-SDFR-AT-0072]